MPRWSTKYLGEHGSDRISKAVLVGAIGPLMLKTATNPEGTPIEVFDHMRKDIAADRAQFYLELSGPFYGANREGAQVSEGLRGAFWRSSMEAGLKGAYDCIRRSPRPT
jgi:non-heme chloroperoxidase